MHNYVDLRFCIWGFEDINHEDITKELSLSPFKIYVKNQEINVVNKVKENGWIYKKINNEENDFTKQLNDLLDLLEEKKDILKKYSNSYLCEFSCAIFLLDNEESTPWIHFDKRYNEFVKDTKIEFDFDIYNPPMNDL